MSYLETGALARKTVLDAIPQRWRLPTHFLKNETNSTMSLDRCGILSTRQFEITALTATELLRYLERGQLTALEVTEAFCARAAIAHQLVNCLTSFFPEAALNVAGNLDKTFAETGKIVGPLHGIPIAVKDMYDVKGQKTTLGYVSWYDHPSATDDSSLVKVMRDCGVVVFGKTTMPQTAMALETYSYLWGRTLNPFNSAFGSGGSSGGDGALVAMCGAPCAPLSSDIGGSIRAPAAFNGLYGMRPSSDRVPRGGMKATVTGQVSIKTSCGPCCRSLADLKMLTKIILTHPTLPYEPTCIPGSWADHPTPTEKLSIGVMMTDGVVEPHPPVKRAIVETVAKLRAAGHHVFEFTPPFNLWDAALTTFALYFQTGAKEFKAALAASGEPPVSGFQHNIDIFNIEELTVPELYALNTRQANFKAAMAAYWDITEGTATGTPMDCIICPSAALAGAPHDFPIWWGYTSIWNLLDYPSIIIPVKDFKIDDVKDAKDLDYEPRNNPFDRDNWEVYDPKLWKCQPVTLQVVGRPCRDERLIAICERLDVVINEMHKG